MISDLLFIKITSVCNFSPPRFQDVPVGQAVDEPSSFLAPWFTSLLRKPLNICSERLLGPRGLLAAILQVASEQNWKQGSEFLTIPIFLNFSRTRAESLYWYKNHWNKGHSPAIFLSVDKMTNWLIPCNECLLYDCQLTETGYPKEQKI